jgi:hypothetical protein
VFEIGNACINLTGFDGVACRSEPLGATPLAMLGFVGGGDLFMIAGAGRVSEE